MKGNKLNTVKTFMFSILLCVLAVPLFPQNKMTFDFAINDFARDFSSQFPNNRTVAVIALETDNHSLMIHFIDTMVAKLMESSNVSVFERQRIEYMEGELNFSLTGLVSDTTAQRIGHFIGADTVIYGVFIKGNNGNSHRMTISASATETAQILLSKTYDLRMDSRLVAMLGDNSARLWTLGISAGSSFSQPLLIGTFRGTIAPFRYSFLELGIDAGIFSRRYDVNYFSISPYVHYAFFWPFTIGGLYAGAGVGYWFSEVSRPHESTIERKILAHAVIGTNILDMIDISYTLRTNFAQVTNKFSVGYTYRF